MAPRSAPSDDLSPAVADEALRWVVRRLDGATWTAAHEQELAVWRAAKPEHDREYCRSALAARFLDQPQMHRASAPGGRPTRGDATLGCDEAARKALEILRTLASTEARAAVAEVRFTEAIRLLQSSTWVQRLEGRVTLARTYMLRGNARRIDRVGGFESYVLADYDTAERLLLEAMAAGSPSWRDDLIELASNRGIALMHHATPAALKEAVLSFERVIELCRESPSRAALWERCRLMAAWMNRGDAISRGGDASQLHEALESYDEAFGVIEDPAVLTFPLFRRRHIVAGLNQASLYLARNGPGDVDQAIRRADDSIGRLSDCSAEEESCTVLVASAWAVRAAAFARKDAASGSAEALKSARIAVDFAADLELRNARAAEAGIKARHALCAAISKLVADRIDATARELFVKEAVVAVDAALEVARSWEARGVAGFGELETALFTFGLGLIETYQPHALGTFCLRYLDPERAPDKVGWRPDLRPTAIRALDQAISRLLHQRIAESANSQLSDYFLDALNSLCPAAERLRAVDSAAE